MSNYLRWVLSFLAIIAVSVSARAATPGMLLTQQEAADIRTQRAQLPLLEQSFQAMKADVEALMAEAIDVPVPVDAGGGYTHERHKKNGLAIYQAATLYQITGEQRYADLSVALLQRYAALYPTLGPHPKHKHQSPGKLFWQILNDAVWLVYVIQGYEQVQSLLSPAQQQLIADQLLHPYVDYLAVESASTFNKIHNHGTWAAAAVGMTGLVLGEQQYVDMALKGGKRDGKSGFLKQLDKLFSPDGYYTEGPYYQRYALMPFVVFARALDRKQPNWKIFEYRDQVLLKAIYACVNLSYNNRLFPLNDAIKDKGLDTIELVYGVDIAYSLTGDSGLLSIAQAQNQVTLTGDGLRVAQAIAEDKAVPFTFANTLYRDGANGDEGGVAVLRNEESDTALVLKAASQGMGHGHFDRLGWLLYDQGNEILSDYGAARYLNVVTKRGGVYLPENTSWAKQTVAHNTLVVDERSHFNGKLKPASKTSAEVLYFSAAQSAVTAVERHAYKGVTFTRTLALINSPQLEGPLVFDLLSVVSQQRHQYDLPLHYHGQITHINGTPKVALNKLVPLGPSNGYQHLWKKAEWSPKEGLAQVSWLKDSRFYSVTTLLPEGGQVLFAELGANDPEFNLRRENALVLRQSARKNAVFLSLLESHGEYNGAREYTLQPTSQIKTLELIQEPGVQLAVVTLVDGGRLLVGKADAADPDQGHQVTLEGKSYAWRGHLAFFEEPNKESTQ